MNVHFVYSNYIQIDVALCGVLLIYRKFMLCWYLTIWFLLCHCVNKEPALNRIYTWNCIDQIRELVNICKHVTLSQGVKTKEQHT